MKNKLEFIKQPTGIFLFIDDNKDEQELFKSAIKALGLRNQLVCCFSGLEALNFLKQTKNDIFMIFCEVHMPKMDGFEFKRIIEKTIELKMKSIPFFFHSGKCTETEIKIAYTLDIQGFLKKANDLEGTIRSLYHVISLWTDVVHPNDVSHVNL
ncbi:MAG: response regulator [Bacteroidota bacterium]|nr:response regulator [Bacteroidota bacterium]